jgi:serine protease Do
MPVIDQLRQFGETRRGWLGVKIQDLTGDIAESLGMKDAKGVLVADVTSKGPAETGGIQAGDVIAKFDGHDVPNVHDLTRMVADTAIAKEVEVIVLRKGKEQTLKITLGRLEDGEKLATAKDPAAAPPPPTVAITKLLGLGLTTLDPASRSKFKLSDKVAKGVVIADIEANSRASDKHLVPGDVILEVGQEEVKAPDDVVKRIEALKQQGRSRALLMLQNGDGAIRFEPLAID